MDTIKTYLDNVFTAFPQTDRVLTIKREMLAGMEEKYQELKREGKSEHEAVGSVISNFGSIDEIMAELGIEPVCDDENGGLPVSRDLAFDYLTQMKKSSLWIGIGVWLILTGISAMLLSGGLGVFLNGHENLNTGALGIFTLFVTIAAAVVLFIINGLSLNRFQSFSTNNLRLDASTRVELEQLNAKHLKPFTALVSVGVVLILLAVGLVFFFDGTAPLNYEGLPVAMMLFVIGLAVFLFIIAGMPKSAFNILLGKGDYRDKVKYAKSERLIGAIAGAYWPLTVAAYLLWSFLGNNWHISWVIWPVAAVLFGAIAGGIGAWYYTDYKK